MFTLQTYEPKPGDLFKTKNYKSNACYLILNVLSAVSHTPHQSRFQARYLDLTDNKIVEVGTFMLSTLDVYRDGELILT